MYFVDNSTAVAVMPEFKPVYSASPTWFTQGDGNNPPTYPGPDTFNMIIAEMINVLEAANIQPKKSDNTQLAQAIRAMINAPEAGWVKTVCNVGPDKAGNIPLTAASVGALPDTYQAPVSSVNSKTGAVNLTAADVGALPDTYTPPAAPVTSVNSKTGAVNLTAADVGALPDTYVPPQPDLSSYATVDWCNVNFVTKAGLSAMTAVVNSGFTEFDSDGRQYVCPAGCVFVGVGNSNSSGNLSIMAIDEIMYCQTMYMINSQWYGAGSVGMTNTVERTRAELPETFITASNFTLYNCGDDELSGDFKFLISDEGYDFYKLREQLPAGIYVSYNAAGVVCQVTDKKEEIWPEGFNLAVISELPAEFILDGTYVYNATLNTVEQSLELLNARTHRKNSQHYKFLLRAATCAAFPLQSCVSAGIATPEQQSMLSEIQQYTIDLMNVNLSLHSPAWPQKPAFI
ncbi:tail fiber assembly protein [Citrobacter braakii]|uniref:tail fiber assembly protein n=1 Tax=Citrobacter braakii TaxID=57706 RepID=UPI004039E292